MIDFAPAIETRKQKFIEQFKQEVGAKVHRFIELRIRDQHFPETMTEEMTIELAHMIDLAENHTPSNTVKVFSEWLAQGERS